MHSGQCIRGNAFGAMRSGQCVRGNAFGAKGALHVDTPQLADVPEDHQVSVKVDHTPKRREGAAEEIPGVDHVLAECICTIIGIIHY